MNLIADYSFSGTRIKGRNNSIKSLNDEEPDYEDQESLLKMFEDRIEDAVDQERFLPDEYSVAIMAMKIGLCRIENSNEDAITLRNKAWLENGKEEKLKQTIIKELEKGPGSYEIKYLEELTAEELLGFYRRENRDWGSKKTR